AGAAAVARFDHAYAFDWDGDTGLYLDGGFVDVKVLDPATRTWSGWKPAAFGSNGPTRRIEAAAGRRGFGGDSRGWLSSRVDLSAYAGRTVRLRFRVVTTDQGSASAGLGWYIDDLRIYACGSAAPAAPTPVAATGGGPSA